jgi:hypothetical protein
MLAPRHQRRSAGRTGRLFGWLQVLPILTRTRLSGRFDQPGSQGGQACINNAFYLVQCGGWVGLTPLVDGLLERAAEGLPLGFEADSMA